MWGVVGGGYNEQKVIKSNTKLISATFFLIFLFAKFENLRQTKRAIRKDRTGNIVVIKLWIPPSDEGNVSIMVDLQLMGHSKRSISTKSHCTWSKKVEHLPCLVVLLPLAIQPLDNIRRMLRMWRNDRPEKGAPERLWLLFLHSYLNYFL